MKATLVGITAVLGAFAVVAGAAIAERRVHAQETPTQSSRNPLTPPAELPPQAAPDRYYQVASPRLTVFQVDRNDPRFAALQILNDLRRELQAAPTTEEKRDLSQAVQEAISDYFDHDLDHRRAELERLVKRAKDMETALSKRADAKEELVDLQLQAIANEAEGLGLFGEHGRRLTVPLSVKHSAKGDISFLNPYGRAPNKDVPTAQAGPIFDSSAPPATSLDPSLKEGNPPDADSLSSKRLHEAYSALTAAESGPEKSAARSDLKTALSKYFDADLEHRRRELEEVKKGLQEMESRLAKRVDAKEEIVDLQVKLFINEAEGLGFFGAPTSATSTEMVGPASTKAAQPARAAKFPKRQ